MKSLFFRLYCTVSSILALYGGVTAIENLTEERLPYWLFAIVAIIALVTAILTFIKRKKEPGVISTIVFLLFSVVPSVKCCEHSQQDKRIALWKDILSSSNNATDALQVQADQNDPVSQYALADRYFKQRKYELAQKYAERAAANGSCEAYLMLAMIHLRGVGTSPDLHQSVRNQIEANHLDYVDNDDFLSKLQDSGLRMDETDSLDWEGCLKQALKMEDLTLGLLYVYYESENNTEFLNNYHYYFDDLMELSEFGFIPASKVIYIAESEEHPEGSQILSQMAQLLQRKNRIPTGAKERCDFRRRLGKEVELTEDRYRLFMKESFFPIQQWEDDSIKIDTMANESLFKLYPYLKAQYSYYSKMKTNPDNQSNFSKEAVYNRAIYDQWFEISDSLLNKCTETIQERMPTLNL